jgi:hypothetical protein
VELAVSLTHKNNGNPTLTRILALVFFLVSVFFVWRSFHKMRIGTLAPGDIVSLNPQPEPPGIIRPGDIVSLNPQPEPPGITTPGDAVTLNRQPELPQTERD